MKTDVIINREALYALRELPSESVNCCVTSPPYYGLRDYGLDMQIGREDTPEQYIDRLVEVFRELRRVLKDDGTFWLNIADTYCGTGMKAGCKQKDLIGIPWFTSHGQWGARGYENIAPGDAIFFDWDLDGSADHVGLVIGRDESRVYTVEGNSGDACKIKSYPLDYACIKGYGLMNWN